MKTRQLSILLLFACLVFVYRIVDGWPAVQQLTMIVAGVLLVAGLGGLLAAGKSVEPDAPKSLWDYASIAMVVTGANLLYRVLEALPEVDPVRLGVGLLLVAGAFFTLTTVGQRRSG